MLQGNASSRAYFESLNAAKLAALGCVMLGLMLIVYPMLNVPYEQVAALSDLTPVHGRIVGSVSTTDVLLSKRVTRYYSTPGRPASVNLIVDAPGRDRFTNHFEQDPAVASTLMGLKDGDEIDMLVDDHQGDSLVDGQAYQNYIWELKHDGQTLLSYEHTRAFVVGRYGNPKALWIRITAVVLLIAAAVLWIFFSGTGSLAEEEESDLD